MSWLSQIPSPGPGLRAKRLIDVAVSGTGLLLLHPVLLGVAAAELAFHGWPPWFSQQRPGLHGRPFRMFKFRSMTDARDGDGQLLPDADRLTPFGRWLRASSLDELPELWNVLVGDMSVVGPRPSPEDENRYCPPWNEARLSVRGGITGLWQVSRTREEGLDFQEWIRYDLEYVQKMSWRLDLWILWRTIIITLKGR